MAPSSSRAALQSSGSSRKSSIGTNVMMLSLSPRWPISGYHFSFPYHIPPGCRPRTNQQHRRSRDRITAAIGHKLSGPISSPDRVMLALERHLSKVVYFSKILIHRAHQALEKQLKSAQRLHATMTVSNAHGLCWEWLTYMRLPPTTWSIPGSSQQGETGRTATVAEPEESSPVDAWRRIHGVKETCNCRISWLVWALGRVGLPKDT